jgi:hypothetical protein
LAIDKRIHSRYALDQSQVFGWSRMEVDRLICCPRIRGEIVAAELEFIVIVTKFFELIEREVAELASDIKKSALQDAKT